MRDNYISGSLGYLGVNKILKVYKCVDFSEVFGKINKRNRNMAK